MIRLILSAFIILLTSSGFAQEKRDTVRTNKIYMSLKNYKLKHKEPLTKNDSLNFRFKDNDTLVLLTDYKRPKGVSVPYEFKDSTFLHYYKKIAFNHPNDSVNKNTTMKYWKDDIRIFFSKSVSKKTKKDLMEFAKTIDNVIDSLRISEVKNVEDSNYIIYYFGDYDYEHNLINYKYSESYSLWYNNKLYRHSIKLDTEQFFSEYLIQRELRKYFIKSLGYFNLIDDFACESYFANCYSTDKKLTKLDIELLKYHYSYGICKGTSLETFEEQHKKAQQVFNETGHQMMFFHEE